MAESKRIRIANTDLNLNGREEILKKLDDIRKQEVSVPLTRTAMTCIIIDEAWQKRFGKKKKKKV